MTQHPPHVTPPPSTPADQPKPRHAGNPPPRNCFGLEPEQQCRAQAARALGWRSPSDTDLPDYHAWWWAELGRLADWIRDGTPPAVEPDGSRP